MSTEDPKTMEGIFNEALDQKVRQRERERFWDEACLAAFRAYMSKDCYLPTETVTAYAINNAAELLLARDASEIRKRPQ